ncbi:putative DNA lyase [Ceratocystis lukuohia]|uniref:DNA lyase n=2 Tax=Ceratocystis TaxID=5157 RepID=A0ABR4MGA8_9PEZI|nr:putative DNA lyase [Ceratocystis fimbriata]AHV84697.1 putative DNA lyase [Ceratocystis fimbriata]
MFATLDADIIIMQECKIQKKDMTDDMVLVPGWDAYFSLPRHKKGYSGVAIYTKTATCTPIRAEEGISGVLCPPGSAISYRDLPKSQQIGGYPSRSQLLSGFDEATLDSEGRCMVLEFPAFVLFGIYSPASCDQDRAGFRLSFFHALDLRIRNLVALGKQVIVAGDLNVSRDIRDSCGIVSALAKADIKIEEYMNDDLRRIFNQQVFGGQVCGSRDAERQEPVLRDLCREFHPERPDMFTCWDTRRNTRPANNGSRIDYVLCSEGLWKWIVGADIQPGLMGSDHCPVYADMSDTLTEKGVTHNLLDLMNPEGVFSQGVRLKQWSTADCLAQSARLMPQFSGRVSIKSMFKRHQSHGRKTAMGPCKEGQVVVDALKESGITMSTCESPVDLQKGESQGWELLMPSVKHLQGDRTNNNDSAGGSEDNGDEKNNRCNISECDIISTSTNTANISNKYLTWTMHAAVLPAKP